MLKPTKKSFKPKEKVNFRLEFHVTLVPQRGWDKLLVSLISVETSKVTAKTGKVPVRNGACQWSEPVYESAFLSQESNGKDADKELYKLVVSMGLSRFGILGEATINLADYVQALAPVSLSLPLQNCNFGSILHVKIQCIKPKSASRDFEEHKEIFLEQVSQPAMFEGGQQTELESCQKTNTENSDKDDSVPLSTPRYSSDSVDVPSTPEVSESHLYSREGMGEELMSPSSSTSSCSGRQESGNTFNDRVRFSRTDQGFTNDFTSPEANAKLSFSTYYSNKSHNGNNNQNDQFSPSESSVWSNDKTKELEAAEVTIKELRLEAVSWQQQGKQLGMQMEALKQQFVEEKKRSDELQRTLFVLREEKKRSDELQRTLLALGEERNSIKQEMKKSKSMEDSHVKAGEGLDWRELQDELEYEKSMNANLILQLRKTLESNSELLLEIQDLERLLQENNQLEKQPNQPSELGIRDLESTEEDSRKTVGALKKELEELERDSQELTEENMDLISQLKQANDKLKAKEATILQLEMKITNEISTQAKSEAGKFRDMVNEMEDKLRDCEESYESKLASSRTLIDDLNSSVVMVRSKNTCLERELQSSEERTSELLKEVESLKMENDGHEREKALIASQKGQLKGLREKAGKAEQENINAAKRVKELEAMNRELKEEKNGVFAALKKQLEDSQEHALATDAKYKEVLQVMAHMRAEKLDFEKEMPMLLKAKEAAEVTVAQLQSFNAVLQEKLQLEQLKTSELLQQCEDSEAKSSQLLEEMKVNQTEIKSLKQAATKVETVVKEMESKVHDLQEENSLCRSQIKELELHKAASEEEMLSLQASRSAFEARSQDLQVVNDELSEKLKNAREDIEWARENTNTLVNEIRELESEIESDVLVRNELKQSVSELEAHNENLQIQVRKLSDKILQLEKEVMDFEGQYKDAMNEKGALVVVIREQESAHKVTEASLQAVIKQQQDKIQQLASDGGNKEKQLLLEVSVLRTEKTGVEEKLRKSQDMLNQAKRDTSNLKEKLELQVYEATVKELDMMKKLDDTVREAQFLRDEKLYCSQRMMELEAKCAVVELEKDSMSAQMSELRSRTEKCELWQREKEEAEKALPILKQEKEKLEALLEHAVQEMATLKESLKSLEDAASQWKQSKAAMEEKISHLQEANAKGSRRPLEEKNSELSKLRKQTSELKHKLSEQELEREELKKRIFSLEEELQLKASALALVEKKLKDRETSAYGGSPVSLFARSLSRANSRVGPMSSIPPTRREAKALADLRERVKLLEGEVKRKEAELAASKQQLKEQHTQLSIKIEHLELANEQLMKENSNSNVDQILKEEKKELEHALLKFKAAANGENFLNRIATLEMELAEALEANNMYKMQLQRAFSKQHNVHVAALENLGSVEQVIQDLADLKRKNLILEDELRNIRERYFNMSLQFAEVEAEREELVMTIRTLQGGKKLKPYRSVNF